MFKQKYSLNTLSLSKHNSFSEHYNKVNDARNQIEKDYIKNVIPNNQKV